MLPKRYSLIVADRTSGVLRRFTLSVRPTLALLAAMLALPVGLALQSRWSTATEIEQLQLRNATLAVENARFRTATTELSGRIAALQLAVGALRDRSVVDPRVRRAMGRLPRVDPTNPGNNDASLRSVALNSPAETFSLLNDLLNMLDIQLVLASDGVEQQQAFAAATPFNLPSDGRVTGRFGYRPDPFTGERTFHPAIDISTGYGQPVYATANGTVDSAARSGAYGNLIEIRHGFGLLTRYGHLSRFAISVGETVGRGDVIGYAGDTGRATSSHVHYEVWVNGSPMNPLQLGDEPRTQSAN
jgi:murein DD-endopeptidase MepM/ murein hydrolase activator NlpD